jgi:lipopolysaccharide transport system ATP-binding protein
VAPAIVFDRVWKRFRRGEHHDSLRDLVPSLARGLWGRPRRDMRPTDAFWAVQDVSFEVGAAEALGIIGPNGAGKSTILKLLTRILRPTRGTCGVHGRVGALIEVAAGFHPDLTGRENVYLQGAIVGMKRAEIARKFDAIVEFAGIGEFIDTPVKRFSSGMNARLGFAIAANLDPEVLIIDEVLSVGDATFQARCVDRMRELIARGVPLVFVSHNLPAVVELCTRAIVVSGGKAVYEGGAAEAVQHYRRTVAAPSRTKAGGDIRLTGVWMLDDGGSPAELFRSGRPMTVRIGYETARAVVNPSFAVDVHRADGTYCYGISTRIDGRDFGRVDGSGYVDLVIDSLQLAADCYTLSAGIHRAGGIGSSGGIGLYDLHDRAYPFVVTSERSGLGVMCLDHEWVHCQAKEVAVS